MRNIVLMKSGVAHPGKTVVPVEIAADTFRERHGKRRDKRSARRKGQELQGDRAAPDYFFVRPAVVVEQVPFLPECGGHAQPS